MVGIYKITNLINNKVYIGQSVNIKKRIADHKRVLSEEHKKKLSDAHKGKNAKQFYCPELDMIFIGTLSAAKYLGLKSSSCILDCIAGRKKSAGKHPTTGEPLHWMYLKDKLS